MLYYMAASNDCHPNYVVYLMNKRTLSVKSINEILGKLEGEKKLLYDKNYVEQLYAQYQTKEINDEGAVADLAKRLSGKKILLAGPGASMQTAEDTVRNYVEANHPLVISINYIPGYLIPDYIFLSNSKRYVQLATALSQEKVPIIATSNVTCANGEFEYVLNTSSLLDMDAEIIDNSLVMLLKALIRMGIKEVTLAGFDGYAKDRMNYIEEDMEYEFSRRMADYLNEYTTDFLKKNADRIAVSSITPSRYFEGGYDEAEV